MTKARMQQFGISHKLSIGYFNGKELYPRSVMEKKCYVYTKTNFA